MEALVVGVLTGITAVVGVTFWQALVRPDALVALWVDPRAEDLHVGLDTGSRMAGALRALRWALGAVLALCGVFTGLAITFLVGT